MVPLTHFGVFPEDFFVLEMPDSRSSSERTAHFFPGCVLKAQWDLQCQRSLNIARSVARGFAAGRKEVLAGTQVVRSALCDDFALSLCISLRYVFSTDFLHFIFESLPDCCRS